MTTPQTEKQHRSPQFVRLFTMISIVLVVVSGIHFSSILTSGATTENIADSIYHLVTAAAFFAASRLVKAGRRFVIYFLGIVGVLVVSYSLMMGRGFNPIMIVIFATFIWQMTTLSKNGELM